MNSSMEVRKLPYSHVKELSQILDYNESWKKLMAIIPKTLQKDNYECTLTGTNPHKYHSEHFKLLENAASNMHKMCAEILFDEWGTSGRVRPALGHLLYLLTKAELYRAAEYVAIILLKQPPPARPPEGPAALVNTNLPDPRIQEVERILDSMHYPDTVISNLSNISRDVNLNYSIITDDNYAVTVPEIVISEPESARLLSGTVLENKRKQMHRQNANADPEIVSDMIRFSDKTVSSMMQFSTSELSTASSSIIPTVISSVIDNSQNQSGEYLPDISALNVQSSTSTISEDLPHFSNLLENVSENVSEIVPNLSMLGLTQPLNSVEMPQLSALLSSDNKQDIPNLKHFLPIQDTSSEASSLGSSKISNASSQMSPSLSRPTCVSPLPNLSLNTPLPHFNYYEVEIATNHFDETPHKNCRIEAENAYSNGRFLGSGAFGSVFLGLHLVDKPVAVKKLFLNNMDVVNIDDPITKQFINEVEVLSKYKHENLLSLVGYSCDGPTYCLIYDFIPGGALKDRLQSVEDKLIWTDRLYIALGTSRAISYLHTAYSTPLIHRDIKTANILLDCSNKPKLCDFGLIKLIPNQNTSTSTCAFGTSAYMAREAFRDCSGDVSVKLDSYSFGVVLLELITGLSPIDENRDGCDIVTHVEEVCDVDSVAPLIDFKAGSWISQNINFAEELYKISVMCLEQNKKKRPTMVEVMNKLSDLIKKCG